MPQGNESRYSLRISTNYRAFPNHTNLRPIMFDQIDGFVVIRDRSYAAWAVEQGLNIV
jgi:hypothetical protein